MADTVQTILDLRSKGTDDDKIVTQLQRQGLKSNEIFDAMNKADNQQPDVPPQQGMEQPPMQDMGFNPQQQYQPQYQQQYSPQDQIEQIAESIIEEKWDALSKHLKKIIDWKESTETRIIRLEQGITSLKETIDKLHVGVLGKINDYEESISNVGSEVKALQKVFEKILPTLTENVNELSRITKKLKS